MIYFLKVIEERVYKDSKLIDILDKRYLKLDLDDFVIKLKVVEG